MKTFLGVEISASVVVVAATPQRGLVEQVERDLPAREPARSAAIPEALTSALAHLETRVSGCDAVGIAVSPPDSESLERVVSDGIAHMTLPLAGGSPVSFAQFEPAALFPLYPPGQGRTWMALGDRARVYTEGADYGEILRLTDDNGQERRVAWAGCTEILEPVRALLYRLGLFDSMDEIERTAGVVEDSAGVRMAPRYSASGSEDSPLEDRYEGVALLGLEHGIRRPQIALAALESVGCSVRHYISDLAGEGAVTELCAVGRYAQSDALLRVVSDLTGMVVVRPEPREAVAYGAAMRAALALDATLPRPDRRRFNPVLPAARRDELFARWLAARSG